MAIVSRADGGQAQLLRPLYCYMQHECESGVAQYGVGRERLLRTKLSAEQASAVALQNRLQELVQACVSCAQIQQWVNTYRQVNV
eukprot:1150767-Amphidinium_carterae.1